MKVLFLLLIVVIWAIVINVTSSAPIKETGAAQQGGWVADGGVYRKQVSNQFMHCMIVSGRSPNSAIIHDAIGVSCIPRTK